ncbi:hypothetical protein [Planktothrix mougeotii]|uniref:Uncharacterized protein n=1 Tax=Planktothrix mougeotii LEGE 06226 TaxID=1828728 RepID=A0ABR9UFL4_9CYAN|nr:hypothetical protein [Planktothrix mougeotii]MBE9145254.1 hypothetical protein [Planktothrix mougeotii LEGE 06226]
MLDILLFALLNLAVILPQYSEISDSPVEATLVTQPISNPISYIIADQSQTPENSDPIVPPN